MPDPTAARTNPLDLMKLVHAFHAMNAAEEIAKNEPSPKTQKVLRAKRNYFKTLMFTYRYPITDMICLLNGK